MVVAAVRAGESTHVLHHTKDVHVSLLEEVYASYSITQGQVLRCRYNDGPYQCRRQLRRHIRESKTRTC